MNIDQENMEQTSQDEQIFHEVVTNERIVTHPKFGEVKLLTPNLSLQRKIEMAVRKKKKELRMTVDEVVDEDGNVTKVPAFKSREALANEYKELGWWSEEQDQKLKELSGSIINHLAELEMLGFETEEDIYDTVSEYRQQLEDLFSEHEEFEKIWNAINTIVDVTKEYNRESELLLRREAPSTKVDEIVDNIIIQRRIYNIFTELLDTQLEAVKLQAEHSNLFADSWQEQLQYFTRLAQVYYCVRINDTGEPLWESLDHIENEEDIDLVRWAFGELDAFWRGYTDEMRERMEKYSFIYGRSDQLQPTEESPAPPESNEDGNTQEQTSESSSEVSATTDQ